MKYSEITLQSWTNPLSQTEENRVDNTIKMIRDAIASHNELSSMTYVVFSQGSYANNTNIRQNSDIDVCVMLTSTFYGNYEEGTTASDYGFSDGKIDYNDFREYVIEALKNKFGVSNMSIGNKCININANSYHVNADIVPAFQYRNYKAKHSKNSEDYIEGIKFFSRNNEIIINYPKEHLNNGKKKNSITNHRYKKLVRIVKHVRDNMATENLINKEIITSFLIECLVWNVQDQYITEHDSWNDTLKASIEFLYKELDEGRGNRFLEVNKMFFLFNSKRKWTQENVEYFLLKMYKYLGYLDENIN